MFQIFNFKSLILVEIVYQFGNVVSVGLFRKITFTINDLLLFPFTKQKRLPFVNIDVAKRDQQWLFNSDCYKSNLDKTPEDFCRI
jgi:hypothetical protein